MNTRERAALAALLVAVVAGGTNAGAIAAEVSTMLATEALLSSDETDHSSWD